jgi:hypothetical protein
MSTYYDPTINLNEQAQKQENKLVNLALTKLQFPHITGLKLQQDVQIGDLVLNRLDPQTGVVWVLTGLEGWWTLPDSEFPDLARGWGDGSYDSDGRYAARVLTLEGSFLTQNPDQVAEARARLISTIDLVYKGANLIVREPITLTATGIDGTAETITLPSHGLVVGDAVTYRTSGSAISGLVSGRQYFVRTAPTTNTVTLAAAPGGSVVGITGTSLPANSKHQFDAVKPKTSFVRVSGRPQIESVSARGRTNFSIGLKAADPIKYEYILDPPGGARAVTLTRNTDIVVVNSGNTPVPVVFDITGTIGTSEKASISRTYGTTVKSISGVYKDFSGTLRINTYSRNIVKIINSTTSIGRIYANSLIDWIYLEPGPNTLRFSSANATSSCVMNYRSGWIG